jgi:2-keto-4-pentenoate hydratase/2-oxohepta-3-ene-1,7-dioic acid hydratase in catechol pathway
VRLNGEVVQKASSKDMIFSINEQISYISSIMTLNPGDVIATGSPDGTGASFNPKRYLKAGDDLEIHVSEIGSLRNYI